MPNFLVKIGHKVLALPICYDLFQTAVGSVRFRREFVRENIENFEMQSVLDLGCGTASTVDLLPQSINYVGLDSSPEYLMKANKRRTSISRRLIEADISDKTWIKESNNMGKTLSLALGIFHHIDDDKLERTLENLNQVLGPSSRVVSLDPVIDERSTRLAQWFAKNDRGQFIREPEVYKKHFSNHGFSLEYKITKNSFRIPYDLVLMTATKQE